MQQNKKITIQFIKKISISIFLLLVMPIHSEVEEVIFKWNAAICRATCIPFIAKQLEDMPQVTEFRLEAHTGIAYVHWNPKVEFSFGYFNFASRAAGIRIEDIRVRVKGTIIHDHDDIYIISSGDNTHFKVVGNLKTHVNQYTIQANVANHLFSEKQFERLLDAEEKREIVTIEGPLFEPQKNYLTIVSEKIKYPKKAVDVK
jgi:hypothetical protein